MRAIANRLHPERWLAAGLLALLAWVTFDNSNYLVAEDHEHDHLHHQHFAEFAKVPERDRAKPNPLASDPEAVAAGRKLFAQHCPECHGDTAEGGRKAPNLRAEEVRDAPPGILFWILTNGVVRRGMPVWSKLPEPQRWQIITFIRALPPSIGMEPHNGRDQTHAMSQTESSHKR